MLEVTSPSNLSSESPENIFGTILLNCTCVVVGGLQKKYSNKRHDLILTFICM
jgi:hypothetical protein